MEKDSFSSVKKDKGKKKVPKRDANPKQLQQKPKVGDGKPKDKCYTCGQKGYYKANCPKKTHSQNGNNSGMPHAYVVETCLMACTTSTWCVDKSIKLIYKPYNLDDFIMHTCINHAS